MKRKLLILLIAILALTLCFTACKRDEEQGPADDATNDVVSIEVVEETIPKEIPIATNPDFSGVRVFATYEDGTIKDVGAADGVTVDPVDTTKAATKKVTVRFGGKSTQFTVQIVDPEATATVVSIKIVAGTMKTSFYRNEVVDYNDLQIEATMSTGSVRKFTKNDEGVSYSNINTSTIGKQTFEVSYTKGTDTFKDSIEVEVFDIKEILVVENSLAKKIFVGEIYNTSEYQLLVEYADGTAVSLTYENTLPGVVSFGSIDNTTAGKKNLTITYNGFVQNYEVEVVGVKKLEINQGSHPTKVLYGGLWDVSNISGVVTFTDDTTKPLTREDLSVATFTANTIGANQITVAYNQYGGISTTINVEVLGVKSMTVVTEGFVSEVLKGQAYSTANLKVSVTYTDNSTAVIPVGGLSVGTIDTNTAGVQPLSIAYLNGSINVNVKVCQLVKIVVSGVPKNNIPAGTPINISNMVVKAVYDDTAETEILLTDGITTNIDDININTEEDKILIVSYNGTYGTFTTNVIITASDPILQSIAITGWEKFVGVKTQYDLSKIIVYGTYTNGPEKLNIDQCVVTISTDTAGETLLTVTYTENGVPHTDTKTVTVLPATSIAVSGGISNMVNKNESLDLTDAIFTVTYTDGTNTITQVLDMSAAGLNVATPPDTSSQGDKQLVIEYLDCEIKFDYHVREIVSVKILPGTVSSGIRYGYKVDYSGLYLDITYSNGDREQILASTLGDQVTYSGDNVGSTRFTVSYMGISDFLDLNVVYVSKISALNNSVPGYIMQDTSESGKVLSYKNFKLSVYYTNGDVYLVPFNDPYITTTPAEGSFMLDTYGRKAIKIYYNDGGSDSDPMTEDVQPFYTEVTIWVKGVTKVEIVGGVLGMVVAGKDLDVNDILVKITYDDESIAYVDRTNSNLHITRPNTNNPGMATLTVEYCGVYATKAIEVKEPMKLDGLIFGALMPDHLVARDSYAKNFKDSTSAYHVGDINDYYFYLNVVQLDDNDNIVDVDGQSVPTVAKIFLVENGTQRELSGAELDSYVKFTSADNSYDFTPNAIGKTFRLQISPADETSYVDINEVTQSQTVTVVNGYNIYYSYEFNLMTNTDNYFTDINGKSVYQKDVAASFLATKGVSMIDNLPGIVLHGNMNVDTDDIPPEYLCTYKDKNGQTQQGLYDHIGVFSHGLTTAQKTFDFYGNYYSVYSYDIPPVVPNGIGNNSDDYSSSDLFKFRTLTSEFSSIDTNINTAAGETIFDDFKVNIRDLATRDNDPNSNDQTASERHMRGIICFKTGANTTTMYNVNIEAYMTSMLAEDSGSTINLNKVNFYNAWQGHLFLWNENFFQYSMQGDDKSIPTANYMTDLRINITDSSLTKCGGPVILAQNPKAEYAFSYDLGSYINATNSDIHTYVTGQEAWFVAVGQTQLAAQIRAMSGLISQCGGQVIAPGHGFTSMSNIENVETINMMMVTMGVGLNIDAGVTYNATFVQDGVVGLKMSHAQNTRGSHSNPALDMYKYAQPSAPIFQTSAGGTALTDGKTGCYGIETGSLGAPQANFYAGDKITLYYMGCGIMLQYYHG